MATKRGENLVDLMRGGDREQRPPAQAIEPCSASGCPLPGAIRTETSGAVCACHLGASAAGWPLATAVIVEHLTLWRLAREAQSSGTPDSMSEELALALFQSARLSGFKSDESQREQYRKAGADGRPFMRLRMAGAIVESAIRAAAHAAAMRGTSAPVPIGETAESKLGMQIRGLENNLRLAA